eukprot:TRINITY_DN26772_c0_g1_i1.p1 TRINITY_DN26772_c0_g1~~TRINITY_DN26772_c0_g1_i1.p1  ORF type:complete len:273 (+),score=42.42 TRINITY_DN26772_c0_g1_i1:67-885(+)
MQDLRERQREVLDHFVSCFAGNITQIKKEELEGMGGAFLLKGFLTETECEYLQDSVEYEEHIDWKDELQESYRKNARIQIKHEAMSEILFKRAQQYLPAEYLVSADETEFGEDNEGLWTLEGANPSLRICKYQAGGVFKPHYDGIYLKNIDSRSLWTFMVYLNSEFEGGSTNFIASPTDPTILHSLRVPTGTLICFPVNLYHEGRPLTSGEKYIMRTDIMFRRRSGTDPDKVLQAEQLVNLAREFERSGECEQAVSCYKKAFKLNPGLERVL